MKEIINRIIDKEFSILPIEITEIVGKGVVNRVFIASMPNKAKYIVRLREGDYAVSEYQKEKWCYNEAAKVGIASPQVFSVGKDGDWAYMIMEFIDGVDGASLKEQHNKLWETLGTYARKITNIKTTGYGGDFKDGVFDGGFTKSWKEYIDYNISCLKSTDEFIKLGVYNFSEQSTIKKIFSNMLKKDFKFGLCHGDLSPRNVMVKGKDIYLIDWGGALVKVCPHTDVTTIIKTHIMEEEMPRIKGFNMIPDNGGLASDLQFNLFLKGFGLNAKDYKKIEKDVYDVLLLDAFDNLRWAIDKCPEGIEGYATYANRVVNKIIKLHKA